MIRIYIEGPASVQIMAKGLQDNAEPSSKLKNEHMYGFARFACIKNIWKAGFKGMITNLSSKKVKSQIYHNTIYGAAGLKISHYI